MHVQTFPHSCSTTLCLTVDDDCGGMVNGGMMLIMWHTSCSRHYLMHVQTFPHSCSTTLCLTVDDDCGGMVNGGMLLIMWLQ